MNGITVNIGDLNSTDLSDVPGGVVTDGMFVEVKGLWDGATRVDATRVEEESTTLGDDGDEVSLGTEPADWDSDDDGLTDGQEDANKDGDLDPNETDPANPERIVTVRGVGYKLSAEG